MKLKIKYKAPYDIEFIEKGEWVDLQTSEDINTVEGDSKMIPLGIAMEIPKGYEAIIIPRSSTYKNYKIILNNSVGLIDSSYCGNNDIWQFPAYCYKNGLIQRGTRICQFRIQLSQKASVWTKIKWLFTSGIVFEKVDCLCGNNRGGFGSTGK